MDRRFLLLGVLGAVACLAAADAIADPPPVAQGDHIRYALKSRPNHPRQGTVVELGDAGLVVEADQRAETIPLVSLSSLEVARGTHRQTLTGAVLGFVPGAVIGGVAGAALACNDEPDDCTGTDGAIATGAMLGAATAAVGALIGSRFHGTRWERVPTRHLALRVVPAPGRGLSARLSLRF